MDSSAESASHSGEDSDEPDREKRADHDRRKNDMDMLMRQHARNSYVAAKPKTSETSNAEARRVTPEEEEACRASGADSDGTPPGGSAISGGSATSVGLGVGLSPPGGKQKKTLFGRLFFGGAGGNAEVGSQGEGLQSLLKEDTSSYDDAWYQRWALRLSKDGLSCTKVATNGKPYERRLHVDSRNLTIEVRGGRGGATGVLLDDLVDVRQGLHSPEFLKFCARFKRDIVPPELGKRALVLQTPARTFSFLFSSESQRDTVAHFVVYLLKAQKRGVMASGPEAAHAGSGKAPKEGAGAVLYQNRSAYDGQFHNYMRHGQGTLTLSDGTKYECEWRNDERHGKGKEFWADGTIFTGVYAKGMRSGHGVMTWPEGSKYSGQFERGRANGEGELVRTDGSVYHGAFSEDCMAGDGHMQWRDGVEYIGQFVGNRREGFGKMVWMSGRWKSYEGHWKDGVQHGHGTLVDQSDAEFSGSFVNGKLDRWDEDGA